MFVHKQTWLSEVADLLKLMWPVLVMVTLGNATYLSAQADEGLLLVASKVPGEKEKLKLINTCCILNNFRSTTKLCSSSQTSLE